ncbi:MAG: sulfatase-like hydrolase/transferase [Terriglobales bacterium]
MTKTKPSLVLITVDCLRADHCGFYGYARPTTPFLDSLASGSVVVPTAVIAGAPTYYSLPAILASRMPLALGREVVGLAPAEDTLATAIREAGYATAAFSAANPYISPRFGYDRGFDLFRDFLDFDAPETPAAAAAEPPANKRLRGTLNRWLKSSAQAVGLNTLYDELYFQYCVRVAARPAQTTDALRKFPSAGIVVEAAESWLASLDSRPFFLWIHLMDPHSPYYPTGAAFEQLTGRKASPNRARYLNEFWNRSDLPASRFERHKQAVGDLYDAGIRGVDTQIARLVGLLKSLNRWDNCAVAFTADHGEEFLEHGRRYHAPVSLTETIARVPLLIRAPGQDRTHAAAMPWGPQAVGLSGTGMVFSHLDLAPTLLEILGVPPPAAFQGTSLWRRLRQEPASNIPVNHDPANHAIAECVYGCTNPFNAQTLLSARLLSVREARYKLVIRLAPGAVEELYDLVADPGEKIPLTGRETAEIRGRLLRIALEHVKKTTAARPDAVRLRGRLRALRLKLQP